MSAASLYRARRRRSITAMTMSTLAAILGLACLAAILTTLVWRGFSGINIDVFTKMTPPPGSDGGLLNAIVGSLLMTVVGILVGAPIGVLAGTYMAEYGRTSKLTSVIRFVNDILLSAPSIVIGLFVYTIMVAPKFELSIPMPTGGTWDIALGGHFSGWAGALALAVIVIPIVVRTTEDMLLLLPKELREAATALGTPRYLVIQRVCYRAAKVGIVTGILLAIARISGETAPLLFTALNNQFWSLKMGAPIASLPVMIFQYALSPYEDWQQLAWTGALLITVAVLGLNIFARSLGAKKRRKA